ncbi:hypothetical protein PLESTM_000937100 [Pleodorina starrii]|nr:hypothetical protein PLESTM_000937100 [Pleodorina starrii]
MAAAAMTAAAAAAAVRTAVCSDHGGHGARPGELDPGSDDERGSLVPLPLPYGEASGSLPLPLPPCLSNVQGSTNSAGGEAGGGACRRSSDDGEYAGTSSAPLRMLEGLSGVLDVQGQLVSRLWAGLMLRYHGNTNGRCCSVHRTWRRPLTPTWLGCWKEEVEEEEEAAAAATPVPGTEPAAASPSAAEAAGARRQRRGFRR